MMNVTLTDIVKGVARGVASIGNSPLASSVSSVLWTTAKTSYRVTTFGAATVAGVEVYYAIDEKYGCIKRKALAAAGACTTFGTMIWVTNPYMTVAKVTALVPAFIGVGVGAAVLWESLCIAASK